jgi:hypothetical protein
MFVADLQYLVVLPCNLSGENCASCILAQRLLIDSYQNT